MNTSSSSCTNLNYYWNSSSKRINTCIYDDARLLFNRQKTKLLCYNVKQSEHMFVVLDNHIIKPCMNDVHLGNHINI